MDEEKIILFQILCIHHTDESNNRFELDLLEVYDVVREFEDDGESYYELEFNQAGEPCCEYRQSFFVKLSD